MYRPICPARTFLTEIVLICRCPAGAFLAANLRARAAAGGCSSCAVTKPGTTASPATARTDSLPNASQVAPHNNLPKAALIPQSRFVHPTLERLNARNVSTAVPSMSCPP